MNIEIQSVGPFEVNCAIVWNTNKKALVIDPGCDDDMLEALLDVKQLTVAAYLLTHGHADHISALASLHTKRPAPVYFPAADALWAFEQQNQLLPYYSVPKKPAVEFIHPETAKSWTIDDFTFQCLETPGHTPGGVCYYFESEKVIFTGDTLFKGTCGRTDLPGGNARTLTQSLKKLAALPPDVTVYPGHNDQTTIGHECRTNFFMQQAAR
ncbi:MAG: MBL fold metallo-hydrolase [Kiritimatiellaceae bacterium]|nr:MBL fold metallo-hydrolase [Kiritimatiellaceae bacterium]